MQYIFNLQSDHRAAIEQQQSPPTHNWRLTLPITYAKLMPPPKCVPWLHNDQELYSRNTLVSLEFVVSSFLKPLFEKVDNLVTLGFFCPLIDLFFLPFFSGQKSRRNQQMEINIKYRTSDADPCGEPCVKISQRVDNFLSQVHRHLVYWFFSISIQKQDSYLNELSSTFISEKIAIWNLQLEPK